MAKPKVSHLQETQKSDQQPLGTLIAAVNELQTREVSHQAQFIQAVIDGHNLEQKQKGGAA
jgi:hypothetical protein